MTTPCKFEEVIPRIDKNIEKMDAKLDKHIDRMETKLDTVLRFKYMLMGIVFATSTAFGIIITVVQLFAK